MTIAESPKGWLRWSRWLNMNIYPVNQLSCSVYKVWTKVFIENKHHTTRPNQEIHEHIPIYNV